MNRIVLAVAALLFILPLSCARPAEVEVSTYVLNVGKFEVATGSYTVDFYLGMKCSEECDPGGFEFMNGRATSVDKLIDTPTEKFYRIQASLSQNIDLRNYPFDRNTLTIEVEDKENTIEEIVYRVNSRESGIDPSVIIVGWEIGNWSASVEEHVYEPYDETYSRYIFGVDIGRVVMTSLIKSFLPVFFMVLVGLLSLLLTADKVTTRLGLNISTLLAAVMFHVNLTSAIPPVGYLTFADKFMIMTYVIMITILASGIFLMRHTDMKDQKKAQDIYKTSLYAIPAMTAILYALVFVIF